MKRKKGPKMETKNLVQNAQNKEYTSFKEQALEMLKQKAARAIEEKGYFKRLDQAKGIFEDEGNTDNFKKKDDSKDDSKDDEDDSKDSDKDEKKDEE